MHFSTVEVSMKAGEVPPGWQPGEVTQVWLLAHC